MVGYVATTARLHQPGKRHRRRTRKEPFLKRVTMALIQEPVVRA